MILPPPLPVSQSQPNEARLPVDETPDLIQEFTSWNEAEQLDLLNFFHEPLSIITKKEYAPLLKTVLALMERLGGQAAVDEAELRFTSLCFFVLPGLLRFIDKHAHLGKTSDWLNEILRSSGDDVGALQVNIIQRAIEVRDFIDPSLARSLRGEAPSRWKKRWRRLKTSERLDVCPVQPEP